MALFAGGCACGAVRYQAASEPVAARMCVCRICQRLTGGAGSVLAFFATDSFTVEGRTGDFASTADSGNIIHRQFCPECGTPLFSSAEVRPHLIGVRLGSLDAPHDLPPHEPGDGVQLVGAIDDDRGDAVAHRERGGDMRLGEQYFCGHGSVLRVQWVVRKQGDGGPATRA